MLESSKSDPFAELTIGTAIATSRRHFCGRSRTVAGRLRNVWRTQINPPHPQSETGTLLRIREKDVENPKVW